MQEFERVLHPVFEQDELTLIIAGGVLGAIAGGLQQVYTVATEGNETQKKTDKDTPETSGCSSTAIDEEATKAEDTSRDDDNTPSSKS